MTSAGDGGYPGSIGGADSGGVPWKGRNLPDAGFAGDDGSADPALLDALTSGDDAAVMARLPGVRLLVPVTAVAAETTTGAHGQTADAQSDMAVMLLEHPDGRTALPAFTSQAALAAFDPQARPVPVVAERAAEAAISERADLIVLDCADAQAREVRASMVWALAQRRGWLPAHADPFVAGSLERAVADVPEVRGHELAEGEPTGTGVLQVELTLVPGLGVAQVQELVTALGERLAADGELRARVDGLAFRVR